MRTVDDVGRSLGELLDSVAGATLVGDAAVTVTAVTYDSRQVAPGTLFLAVPGEKFDGHDFLSAAIQAGASAVVVQGDHAEKFADVAVPRLIVSDVRRAMPYLASAFWGDPTRALYLAGVTGTNGKTTTALMIDAIARAAGDITGYVGTLGATVAGQELPGDRTTPESPDLQALFAQMLAAGAKSAAIEVASHALALGRTDGCAFDVGVFTNLTQDHLDFHGTMESYRDAKAILFTDYADAARAVGKHFVAVLNADDPAGRYYCDVTRAERTVLYSPSGNASADIVPQGVQLAVDRIAFTAKTPSGSVPITLGFGGTFNVANALAAIGYGVARGLSLEIVARGLAQCPPVPGRFQPVQAGQPYAVLVDYAHTPDGIENVLKSARPLTPGRLIAVFGCGGNRDRTKRPKMGRLALELSDIAVVTSDNPRREDPEAIIDEILTGMQGEGAEVRRESDRRKAIGLAVSLAQPGDTVVIAGKGHETYQIVGDQTYPFDDVAVAGEEIRRCSGTA